MNLKENPPLEGSKKWCDSPIWSEYTDPSSKLSNPHSKMYAYLMGKKKTHILVYAKPLELIKLAHENGEQDTFRTMYT